MERRGEKMPQNNEYMLKQDDAELIYQKKLTAGTNITIDPVTNTISSTGGGGSSVSYSGSLPQGYGDTIGIITIDGTQYPIKVRNLIQGSNINIVQDMTTGNLTISSTAQGTHVEANPSDPATARLSTIEIGSIVYDTTYDVFEAPETSQDTGVDGLVPAPTYADVQANKVLGADGTWVPQSGGSGNVTDVYVNGTSVLDENDIAQVFSHEEITEINYDNLPSTKFSDNHMYLIKEAGTPPTGEYYNPVIYSTEEREVGVWLDNKPLYKKSYVLQSLIVINNNGTNINSYIDNMATIEQITNAEACNSLANLQTSNIFVAISKNNLNAYCAEAGSFNIITLWYTKTTDVAGSGSYNTFGVPTVHYSTDEQVVGTWTDGKPLYQKTFSKQQVDSNDGLIPTESNLDFKYVYGTFRRTEDNALIMLPFQATSIYCRLYAEYSVYGGILLETNMSGSAIVTAIYTKITD